MSNKTVGELIGIIESSASSLGAQLDAVRKLGGLRCSSARDYLRKINQADIKEERRGDENRYTWPSQVSFIERVSYPHTKGELQDALHTETAYDDWSNTPGAYPTQYSSGYTQAKKVLDEALRRVNERERQAVQTMPLITKSRFRALWYFISGR